MEGEYNVFGDIENLSSARSAYCEFPESTQNSNTNKKEDNLLEAVQRNSPLKKTASENANENLSVDVTAAATTSAVETIEIDDDMVSFPPSASNVVNQNLMLTRRQYVAELAARCPTIDVVDLTTSPLPRIEGVINVDTDTDENSNQASKIKQDKEYSAQSGITFDEENPETSVKIVWQGKPEIFMLRKYQNFANVFEQLAEREKTTVDKVFLNLNSQILEPTDTPASIDYKIYQFIDGRVMLTGTPMTRRAKEKRNPNLLIVKVQSDKWKKPLCIELLKTDNFKKLVIKCAEELKMPYNDVKLSFDGDMIRYDDTPIDLEFEGGEVFEIHLKNQS